MDVRERSRRCRGSLLGLSVGDALGESFFGPPDVVVPRIAARTLPAPVRRWTDDTAMAAALVVAIEAVDGDVDDDLLMACFVAGFEVGRGFGPLTRDLIAAAAAGADWRPLVSGVKNGQGSWGNGAAMRVAPLGAWHAADPVRAADLARRQARVTHGHPDAAEGAAAVAVAAAVLAADGAAPTRSELLSEVASLCRAGGVRDGLMAAAHLGDVPSELAAQVLGSGREVSAADTVPFALWAVAGHPDDLVETFWTTVAGLGDRDTTCAIACGVAAARVGSAGIPLDWLGLVEPLPGPSPLPSVR